MIERPTSLAESLRLLEAMQSKHTKELAALSTELETHKALFDKMLHEVHLWDLVRDEQGEVQTWRLRIANPAALQAWGLTLEEVVGKTPDEIWPEAKATELFMPVIKQIFESGAPHTWEVYFPGTGQTLHMVSIPNGDSFISTGLDVSERGDMERTLRESEAKYRALFEASHDGILIYDAETMAILNVNPVMEALYGYSRDELIGMNCLRLSAEPEDSQKVADTIKAEGVAIVPMRRHRKKDGTVFPVELDGYSLKVGEKAFAFAVIRDITQRIEAETEQQHGRAMLEEAEAIANLGSWEWDIPENRWTFSENWLRIHGCSARVISREELMALACPEDVPDIQRSLENALSGKATYDFEHRIVRQDNGEIRSIHARGKVLRDSAGQPLKMWGTAQDITERKQTEGALKRQQYYLQKAQSLGQIGTWYLDITHNKLVWTDETCRLFGMPPGSVLNYEVFIEKIHPEDRAYVDRKWAAALQGSPYDIEHRLLLEGETRWVREKADVTFDKHGVAVSATGITQDITERKKAEEDVAQSRQRLESLWRIAAMVKASTQELCNKTLEEIQSMTKSHYSFFGFLSPNEDTLIIHSWSRTALAECGVIGDPIHFPISKAGLWANAVRERRPIIVNDYNADHPHKLGIPAGHVPITRMLAVPIFIGDRIVSLAACANKESAYDDDDVKALETFCTSIHAILQQRQEEEMRRELEANLRQTEKMSAIGQLAGGIAHDFNNQLSGVLGYADMLENRLQEDRLCRYATNIKKGAKRAAELTAQLLAFSRKGKNLSVPVNIHKLLADVTDMLGHTIDKRISLFQTLHANPATVTGDPTQLQNAILNIALNARDAMPKGGELRFETALVTLDDLFCTSAPENIAPGRYLKIIIADNGSGMSEEVQKHIFEPFYTTKEQGEGTGMGLASAYGTIRNHNGLINVESLVGKGSTFTIHLPLTADAHDIPEGKGPHALVLGAARILLVDDEETVREVASDMLQDLGYTVTVCRDGKEAVGCFEKSWREIDLVILDMVMPELGGKDTFAAMKKINPDVRAILSSGYSIDGEAQSILDDGVKAFVAKPFELTDLSEKVAQALAD